MTSLLDRVRLGRKHTLPVIQQSEVTECGLACLTMIARFHGHDVDLPSLRRRFPVSQKGTTLSRLVLTAEKLEFDSRPLRVEIEYLQKLKTPCILHWDLNHFVVLKKVRKNSVEVHDPARGQLTISHETLGHHFTGIVLELTPSVSFVPIRERRKISLLSLVGRLDGLYRSLALVLTLALALEVFTLVLPLAMQWVLDHVLVNANRDLLSLLGIGFLTVIVFQSLTMMMRGWVIANVGASMTAQWATNLFGQMLRLPMAYFSKRHIGEIISRFNSLHAVQRTLTSSFVEAVLDGLTVVFVLFVLVLYSLQLAFIVVGAFSVYLAVRLLAFKRLRRLNEEWLVQVARQESQIIESARGMQAIKLANKQSERRARIANTTTEVAARQASIQRMTATFNAMNTMIFGVQRILLIWIGAWMVLGGQLTVGMMVAFIAYAEMFSGRGSTLIDRLVDLRLLGLHGERIADIALEPPEQNLRSAYIGCVPAARIEVENLGFRYADEEPWVLRHATFAIDESESVAIVGESGCGKSTLAKILLGLLEPTEGVVRIDGIEIQRFGLERYRDMCAAVMQDDVLLSGSLADNISFFDLDAGLEEIKQAAQLAGIHDEIATMTMGYETLVGDMGSVLSGGQKQRVLLARALFRKPRILLLDEATSHLDSAREKEINKRVKSMNMTRIVIAHRPDTIASADRVITLKEGTLFDSPCRKTPSATAAVLT